MRGLEPRDAWRCLFGAVVVEVGATVALRAALDTPALYCAAVAGYAVSFALLGAALRRGLNLARAYGVWGAAGIVGTATVSWAAFGEPIGFVTAWGFAVVVAGVWCLESGAAVESSGSDSAA